MAPVMICGSCKTAFRGKDALVAVQRHSRWAHAGTVCRIREIYPKVPRLLNENRKLSSALARTATWVKESPLASVGKKTSSPSRPGSVRLGDNVTKIIDSFTSPDPSVSGPSFRGDAVLVASSTLDCPCSRSSRSQEGDAFPPTMVDRASAHGRLSPLTCCPGTVFCDALGAGSSQPSFGGLFSGRGNEVLHPLWNRRRQRNVRECACIVRTPEYGSDHACAGGDPRCVLKKEISVIQGLAFESQFAGVRSCFRNYGVERGG